MLMFYLVKLSNRILDSNGKCMSYFGKTKVEAEFLKVKLDKALIFIVS